MKLTAAEVDHVAELARLGLTPEERDRLTTELSKILEYIDQLDQLDTSGVEPTAQVGGLVDVFRDDEVRPSLDVDAALANAPATDGEYFTVGAMQE